MKRLATLSCFLYCCFVIPVFAQPTQANPLADPYKATLDHLQLLTTMPLPEWRSHADVPHPEDASLNDTDWQTIKVHEEWETGPRVVRRWIEIPGKINGSRTSLRNNALPGNCARSSARAAGTPNVSEIAIAASATSRLLSTESQMGASAKSMRYQSSVR